MYSSPIAMDACVQIRSHLNGGIRSHRLSPIHCTYPNEPWIWFIIVWLPLMETEKNNTTNNAYFTARMGVSACVCHYGKTLNLMNNWNNNHNFLHYNIMFTAPAMTCNFVLKCLNYVLRTQRTHTHIVSASYKTCVPCTIRWITFIHVLLNFNTKRWWRGVHAVGKGHTDGFRSPPSYVPAPENITATCVSAWWTGGIVIAIICKILRMRACEQQLCVLKWLCKVEN